MLGWNCRTLEGISHLMVMCWHHWILFDSSCLFALNQTQTLSFDQSKPHLPPSLLLSDQMWFWWFFPSKKPKKKNNFLANLLMRQGKIRAMCVWGRKSRLIRWRRAWEWSHVFHDKHLAFQSYLPEAHHSWQVGKYFICIRKKWKIIFQLCTCVCFPFELLIFYFIFFVSQNLRPSGASDVSFQFAAVVENRQAKFMW